MRRSKHLRAIVLAYISLFLFGLCDNIRGPLFPEILKEFSVSDTIGSLFFAGSSLMGVFGSYLAQRFIKKKGSRLSFLLALVGLAAGQGLAAIAFNFSALIGAAAVMGVSFGALGVIQNFLVIKGSHSEKLQQTQAGLHSMYGAASFLAPILVNIAQQFTTSWRFPFFACFLLGCLMIAAAMPQDEKMDQLHLDENVVDENAAGATSHHHRSNKSFEKIYFSVMLALYVVAEIVLTSRGALFLRREHGMNLEQSSSWMALFFACLMVGRILFIFWRPGFSVWTQMRMCLVGSFVCFVLGVLVNPWALVVSGLTMAPFYPLAMTAAGEIFKSRISEVMAYIVSMTSIFIVSMHMLVGFVSDSAGIRTAIQIGPLALLASFLMHVGYNRLFSKKGIPA